MSAVSDFVAKEFGGRFLIQTTVVAVGVAVVKAVDHNFERLAVTFVNLTASPIYLLTDSSVATTKGLQLLAQGASLLLNVRDDGVLTGWEWFAVSSAAAQSLLVMETIRYREAAAAAQAA